MPVNNKKRKLKQDRKNKIGRTSINCGNCSGPGRKDQFCSYDEELYDKKTPCTCCESCMHECYQDV
jgi:hypothetical protein